MAIFQGAGVALITPMKENLDIHYEKLDELLEEQIAEGTDAIIICGTTGESATMSEQEHIDVIRFAIERVNHRIPVIAGTGSNCTATAVQLSQEAAKVGADGLLVVTPYYNKATQKGLIAHYKTIADAVATPIIMYNVPSRTGCALQPQTIADLVSGVENIVGVKEATGNIRNQNVAPRFVHDMVMNYLNGDVKTAAKMQLDCLPLYDALFCEVNPIPAKAAMNMMGKNVGSLRAPLTEMEDHNKEILKKVLTETCAGIVSAQGGFQ